jgi:hypothetical protein
MASGRAPDEHTSLPRIARSLKVGGDVMCDDTARPQLEGEARLFTESRFSPSATELATVLDRHLGRWQELQR